MTCERNQYEFTNTWFSNTAKINWEHLIPQIKPKKILEIGVYEGASTCFLIDVLAKDYELEMHSIDTWDGGIEHKIGGSAETDMNLVETRFRKNIHIANSNSKNNVTHFIHKDFSDICLVNLLASGKRDYFDFIYIDGSHQAPDVLSDAVLSFKLLKIGGVLCFDDYIWAEQLSYGKDVLRCPKIAIDAFVNINFRKLNIIHTLISQFYIQKISN